MVTVLSGENAACILGVLPGSDALPAKEGTVVPAAGVDGVHVGHQNLKMMMLIMMIMMVMMVSMWVTKTCQSNVWVALVGNQINLTLQSPHTLP